MRSAPAGPPASLIPAPVGRISQPAAGRGTYPAHHTRRHRASTQHPPQDARRRLSRVRRCILRSRPARMIGRTFQRIQRAPRRSPRRIPAAARPPPRTSRQPRLICKTRIAQAEQPANNSRTAHQRAGAGIPGGLGSPARERRPSSNIAGGENAEGSGGGTRVFLRAPFHASRRASAFACGLAKCRSWQRPARTCCGHDRPMRRQCIDITHDHRIGPVIKYHASSQRAELVDRERNGVSGDEQSSLSPEPRI
jgi:hypothetical protein